MMPGTFKTYLFFRLHNGRPFFYPAEYADDEKAIEGAAANPGTVQITRANGEIVWPIPAEVLN